MTDKRFFIPQFIAVLLLTGPPIFSPAQALELDDFAQPDSAIAMALDRIGGSSLSLREALTLGRQRAPEVAEAEAVLRAASGAVRRERGEFDPELYMEVERRADEVPSASPFSGADVLKTGETSAGAGVRIHLPTGTEIDLSVNASRLTTNSTFAALDPQVDASGALTIRQQLLSGFGSASRKDLTAAERIADAAQARYEDALLVVRVNVESLYWDLYAAQRDLAVQELIRARAVVFSEAARLRAKAGLTGPNDVASAEVFRAEQEVLLLDASDTVDRLSDRLGSLVGQRPDNGESRFRPTDDPPTELPVPDLEEALDAAVRNNHQLAALRAEEEAVQALARAASRDRLPDVDLVGSLGGNGLSGTGQTVIFGADTLRSATSGGYGNAVGQVLTRDFPKWSIALQINMPIGLREGKGEFDRLRAESARSHSWLVGTKRRLDEAVRQQHRLLAGGSARLEATKAGVSSFREQVRIGLVEYRNGRSTAFQVVRLAGDLATAERRYTAALVQTAKAAAVMRRLVGEEGGE